MKTLVVQTAALGYGFWRGLAADDFWAGMKTQAVETVFPALTCPVQSSFRTAATPTEHGVVANGFFDRRLRKAFFWEQSSGICEKAPFWTDFRNSGGTVGQFCWQQSVGPECDLLLSPGPIHKHHGGMIMDFHRRPDDLYDRLCGRLGRKFNLRHYWGPFTSVESSLWIADAAKSVMSDPHAAPDLFLLYIPHLDYDLQRYGPEHPKAVKAFRRTENILRGLRAAAAENGYQIIIFGDYAINPVAKVVFPNRALRAAGFLKIRSVKGMAYPDLNSSTAFALVDHQVAHIHIDNQEDIAAVRKLFEDMPGVAATGDSLGHPNSGELVLRSEPNAWFAYPWWERNGEAPDYASHVDIHNKPGFDPCELFAAWWPPMGVPQKPGLIGGSHGLTGGSENQVLWASSIENGEINSLIDGAVSLAQSLAGN